MSFGCHLQTEVVFANFPSLSVPQIFFGLKVCRRQIKKVENHWTKDQIKHLLRYCHCRNLAIKSKI